MLIERDSEQEKKIIENLITSDESLKNQHEIFREEMQFKQQISLYFVMVAVCHTYTGR